MRQLNLKTYRKIGSNEYLVSTVDLQIEHPGGMWFETMIFPAKDEDVTDWGDLYCNRYKTKEEAEAGHQATILMTDAEFQEAIK